MTITDTVPYASVAEANDYFDIANNHLYCDEWWSANAGSYASYTAGMSYPLANRLTFVARNIGVTGNLISVKIETGTGPGGALTIVVSGNYILIQLPTGGGTTYGTRTAVLASAPAMVLLSDCIKYGNDYLYNENRKFLYGGVDADANSYGMQLPSLCLATRRIDDLGLAGRKAVATQVNQFPRIYTKPDGSTYTQTAVPEDVKQACCEEALAILKYGNTIRYKLKTEGVQSYDKGALSETFNDKGIPHLLSPDAIRIMQKYCRKGYNIRR